MKEELQKVAAEMQLGRFAQKTQQATALVKSISAIATPSRKLRSWTFKHQNHPVLVLFLWLYGISWDNSGCQGIVRDGHFQSHCAISISPYLCNVERKKSLPAKRSLTCWDNRMTYFCVVCLYLCFSFLCFVLGDPLVANSLLCRETRQDFLTRTLLINRFYWI